MARNESDREDMMAEAVSLVRRVEFRSEMFLESIIAGFNLQGWMFLYIGSDPMYRFDELGRLRRAFVDGRLYRTQGHTLAVMDRQRTFEAGEPVDTTLVRQDLSADELEAFRLRMHSHLNKVSEILRIGVVTRQHPAEMPRITDEVESRIRLVLNTSEFLAPAIVRR